MPEQGIENELSRTNLSGSNEGDNRASEGSRPQDSNRKDEASSSDGVLWDSGAKDSREKNSQTQSKEEVEFQERANEVKLEEALKNHVAHSINDNVIALNALAIKRIYPKTFQLLKEYMQKRASMLEGEIEIETIIGVMLYSPRSILPEFLDDHKIYLNLRHYPHENTWMYVIDNDTTYEAKGYTSRIKAEVDGYDRAFAILERNLKSK